MRRVLCLNVLIAGLGYFVDMFDITIFGVVRMASLRSLGFTDPEAITRASVTLLNLQAFGMLIGGVVWGIIGDRRGRLSVLFGSIILYSIANLLNAFVTDFNQYAILRFLAGVGLAGELGAAVTLVSETLSKEDRGYGTAIIATLGLLGAVAASGLGQLVDWKIAYLTGGLMGLALLVARFRMVDSKLFHKAKNDRYLGDPRLLLNDGRWGRYLLCVLAGVPIYFTSGILLTFAPELARSLRIEGVTAGNALLFGCIGITLGDLASGILSQLLKSRKLAIYICLVGAAAGSGLYLMLQDASTPAFYSVCFLIGLFSGYWAVFVTVTAEQFGTNIRATVATSVPNFVRSSVILLTLSFSFLRESIGITGAAAAVGGVVFAAAALAVSRLSETYGKDLDYLEVHTPEKNSTPTGEALLETR